jgi:hypothetical protein
MYTITNEKLEQVTAIVNRDTDPAATDELIRTEIEAGWHGCEGHQKWIDSASVEEIADWIASFYGD